MRCNASSVCVTDTCPASQTRTEAVSQNLFLICCHPWDGAPSIIPGHQDRSLPAEPSPNVATSHLCRGQRPNRRAHGAGAGIDAGLARPSAAAGRWAVRPTVPPLAAGCALQPAGPPPRRHLVHAPNPHRSGRGRLRRRYVSPHCSFRWLGSGPRSGRLSGIFHQPRPVSDPTVFCWCRSSMVPDIPSGPVESGSDAVAEKQIDDSRQAIIEDNTQTLCVHGENVLCPSRQPVRRSAHELDE